MFKAKSSELTGINLLQRKRWTERYAVYSEITGVLFVLGFSITIRDSIQTYTRNSYIVYMNII